MNLNSIPNEEFFAQVKDILACGDSVRINVKGRSMDPTFKDGKDKVVISPFKAEDLKVGDVVLFDRKDTICLHRIIKRKGDRLVIRGDGNTLKSLEFATVSDVIAIVTAGTMYGGKPFTTEDEAWKKNTGRIFRYFPILSAWHRLLLVLRHYYLSIITLFVLFYFSFSDPSTYPVVTVPNADKYFHALMYFGLSVVFWFEWLKLHIGCYRAQIRKGIFFCVLFPILIGIVIELGQEFLTEYRYGDIFDVVANSTGTFLAVIFSFLATLPVLKRFFGK